MRYARECGLGKPYTNAENMQRSEALSKQLVALGYGITKGMGGYIENYGSDHEIEVDEKVFIVMDIKDRGMVKSDLVKLGTQFEQDSILYLPKGAESGELIGTNRCPNGYPGYGKSIVLKNPIFGKKGRFYTKIQGRPFVLEEGLGYIPPASGFFGRWGAHLAAKRDWQKLMENENDSILD